MTQNSPWTAKKIRQQFFDFFKEKEHKLVSSAPIVLKDDPTLMFTNAGMNQFKDAFLGNAKPPHFRVVDSQKCLRVSGKHNDLEEVGHDTYHHTMFEMLGNWSFGDYFKDETIAWAWELLTEVYQLPPERMYATVFEGDAKDRLARDTESEESWKKLLPAERILDGSKKDNFWEMGATGPCGPCSEIHIDLRSEDEIRQTPGAELVNRDHPQVVEIWNLVFMEFNRLKDGRLEKLPAKHVDTGMGLERLAMALQGKQSNYDIDLFQALIEPIAKAADINYGVNEPKDIAMRVVADHLRAVAFAIADGQLPGNTGAGYVIRRILRRAIRYAYSYLDISDAFIYRLVEPLRDQMSNYFPELSGQYDLICKVIREEEQSFLKTLAQGLQRLDQIIAQAGEKQISGAAVFELYDTYGFPPDLTALILREKGLDYDEKAYAAEMRLQKDRARKATKKEADDWVVLKEDDREEFIGYDQLETEVRITRYRKMHTPKGEFYQLVFNLTPFYPEGGGQVGDQGWLIGEDENLPIIDTQREHGLILHHSPQLPANPQALFKARVHSEKRAGASINHTATHLLHQALRDVLGDHVEQKGSLVHPEYLRFDFSHFAKVSDDELAQIESLVNHRIREDHPLEEFRNIPITEARKMGALALFGEKYGDTVRAIKFGDSIELCGGIHVPSSGRLGLFKIKSEGAVAAGIRRIEALSGDGALEYVNTQLKELEQLRSLLKNPKNTAQALENLQSENQKLRKKLEALEQSAAESERQSWLRKIEKREGLEFLIIKTTLNGARMKDALHKMRTEHPKLVAVVGSDHQDKPQLAVALGDEVLAEKQWKAGVIVKDLAREIKGGGGGQPGLAMAGGKDLGGLKTALERAHKELR